jgi:hypothetical protein
MNFKIMKLAPLSSLDIFVSFLLTSLVLLLSGVSLVYAGQQDASFAKKSLPQIGSISTITPSQFVKELTASPYISEFENDFNRDGKNEIIVASNCKQGFCVNFVFNRLRNGRYEYMGFARFHREYYELVWRKPKSFADIVFFRQQNIGQGCIGRYNYIEGEGYQLGTEVCRLPKKIKETVSSYKQKKEKPEVPKIEVLNPDVIDLSDIKYDDNPEDFFPEDD